MERQIAHLNGKLLRLYNPKHLDNAPIHPPENEQSQTKARMWDTDNMNKSDDGEPEDILATNLVKATEAITNCGKFSKLT